MTETPNQELPPLIGPNRLTCITTAFGIIPFLLVDRNDLVIGN
jgi:hypothetical protein